MDDPSVSKKTIRPVTLPRDVAVLVPELAAVLDFCDKNEGMSGLMANLIVEIIKEGVKTSPILPLILNGEFDEVQRVGVQSRLEWARIRTTFLEKEGLTSFRVAKNNVVPRKSNKKAKGGMGVDQYASNAGDAIGSNEASVKKGASESADSRANTGGTGTSSEGAASGSESNLNQKTSVFGEQAKVNVSENEAVNSSSGVGQPSFNAENVKSDDAANDHPKDSSINLAVNVTDTNSNQGVDSASVVIDEPKSDVIERPASKRNFAF